MSELFVEAVRWGGGIFRLASHGFPKVERPGFGRALSDCSRNEGSYLRMRRGSAAGDCGIRCWRLPLLKRRHAERRVRGAVVSYVWLSFEVLLLPCCCFVAPFFWAGSSIGPGRGWRAPAQAREGGLAVFKGGHLLFATSSELLRT